jgi:hypothetical protein
LDVHFIYPSKHIRIWETFLNQLVIAVSSNNMKAEGVNPLNALVTPLLTLLFTSRGILEKNHERKGDDHENKNCKLE